MQDGLSYQQPDFLKICIAHPNTVTSRHIMMPHHTHSTGSSGRRGRPGRSHRTLPVEWTTPAVLERQCWTSLWRCTLRTRTAQPLCKSITAIIYVSSRCWSGMAECWSSGLRQVTRTMSGHLKIQTAEPSGVPVQRPVTIKITNCCDC